MLANRGFAYIHSLMDSGSADITVTFESAQGAPVAGTQNNTMTFNLVPSVWRFSSTEVFLGRGDSALNFGLYDITGETGAQEAKSLRPGATATIGFITSDPSIGSVQPNPILVIGPAVPVLKFTALKPGQATITVQPVAGFASDPSVQVLKVTVN